MLARQTRGLLRTCVLSGSLALTGCSAPDRPSVVWIIVDTLRADHLEWYGYERETSPELASLVSQGVLFEQALTPQPETSPAIASLLTGLYPPGHGVRALYLRLHDQNRSAAELFAAAGYETAAFVSSFVMIDDFTNFGQGFEIYEDFVSDRELSRSNFERRAGATIALARSWFDARRSDRPFFLFLHLIDPHGPYTPPGEWETHFTSTDTFPIPGRIANYQQLPGLSDFSAYRDRYDGEIAYLFSQLGPFFDHLERAGILRRSLVVLTADHGESLGERDRWLRHGDNVFQENLRVPLIIRMPDSVPGPRGVRRSEPVSLVDLLPTSLEVTGLAVPGALDGRSLLPALSGGSLISRPVYAWSRPGGPVAFAKVEGTKKWMLRRDVEPEQMLAFDLISDPGELRPLDSVEVGPEQLASRLGAWTAQRTPFVVEANFMATAQRADFIARRLSDRDRDDLARLRSLGYIN